MGWEVGGQNKRSVDGADPFGRRNLIRLAGQPMAAVGAGQRLQQPNLGELLQNLGQQWQRNPVALGTRLSAGRDASGIDRQVLQRDQPVVRFLGQLQHETIYDYSSPSLTALQAGNGL